jgi:long-chain acyl-CoA synthetase
MTAILIEQLFGTLSDLIREHALQQPNQIALRQRQHTLTYAELDLLMDRIASALQRDGILPQQCIALCAANSIAYAAVFLGALRAGIVVAPLAPSAGAASLAAMLRDAGARLLFADAANASVLDQGGILCPIGLEQDALAAWLGNTDGPPQAVIIEPNWAFNIIYSSGTTGTPKGIVQSHAMRWTHMQRGAQNGYRPGAVTLLATPLYSNTTLVSFLPTLALGGSVILTGKFDAATYLQLAAAHRVTHSMLVPVQYQRIMAHPDFDQYDLSSFEMKYCTSAPFAASLKADILQRWPGGLVEYYGMTEGGGTCVLTAHEAPHKLHTVGRPAPGHEIRLIDDSGQLIGAGLIGEVVGRSAAMMNGYFAQPEATAAAEWYSPDGLRFIRTGDIGRFDEDGFLTLLDRKKDMIISGGFNVYPSDLEAALSQHPAVVEVAVVGVPSQRWGETPVGFVVLQPTADITLAELLDWVNQRLGKTQRLAALEPVAALPRSAIGKVLKRTLRDEFGQRPAGVDQAITHT